MKIKIILIVTSALFLSVTVTNAQRKTKLKTEKDSLSYAIGISFAVSLQNQNMRNVDVEKIYEAMEDAINDHDAVMTPKESLDLIRDYVTRMQKLQEEQKDENLIKANAFLEENKNKPGVVVLSSGLQYKIIKKGEGLSPLPAQRVKTHYKGTLLDGTVFDSSYDRGEPIEFGLTQVIKGWQEALQIMKPGAKWILYVHPDLGYGERAAGMIPPNSLLIFEIELLSVE